MKFYGLTDTGLRRYENQDAFYCGELADDVSFAIVCDGMGGENAGQLASQTALDIVKEKIEVGFNPKMEYKSIKNLLTTSIKNANLELYGQSLQNEDLKGMGTTIVVVIINGHNIHIAHVGDSRAYVVFEEDVHQITVDHSVVQQLVDNGKITAKEARTHPDKNIITRAVGVEIDVQVDYTDFRAPETSRLILCSDGLSNYCETRDFIELLSKDIPIPDICENFVKHAYKYGASDNITVVLSEKF